MTTTKTCLWRTCRQAANSSSFSAPCVSTPSGSRLSLCRHNFPHFFFCCVCFIIYAASGSLVVKSVLSSFTLFLSVDFWNSLASMLHQCAQTRTVLWASFAIRALADWKTAPPADHRWAATFHKDSWSLFRLLDFGRQAAPPSVHVPVLILQPRRILPTVPGQTPVFHPVRISGALI